MADEQEERCEIVLWNISAYEFCITQTLKCLYEERRIPYQFYHNDEKIPELCAEKRYLLFYAASDEIEEKKARDFRKKMRLKISFAALCSSDEEGIRAVQKGDFYALRLPLGEQKIGKCIELFLKTNQRSD